MASLLGFATVRCGACDRRYLTRRPLSLAPETHIGAGVARAEATEPRTQESMTMR